MRQLFLLLLLALGPVALAAQSPRERPCTGGEIDSAWTSASAVYRDCEVDRPARERSLPLPPFTAPIGIECATVDLEFVVDTLGRVELATVRVVATNVPEFATRAVERLQRARYHPALHQERPVRQLVRARMARSSGRVPFVVRDPFAGAPRPSPDPQPPPPRCA